MLTYLFLFLLFRPGHQSSPCDPNPCLHGGHCQTETYWPPDTPYQCTCLAPWSGKTCNEGGPPIQDEEDHGPITTEAGDKIDNVIEGINEGGPLIQGEEEHGPITTEADDKIDIVFEGINEGGPPIQEEEEHEPNTTEADDEIDIVIEGINEGGPPIQGEEEHEPIINDSEDKIDNVIEGINEGGLPIQEEEEHEPNTTEADDKIDIVIEGIPKPLATEQQLNEYQLEQYEQRTLHPEQNEQHTQQPEQYEQTTLQPDPCTKFACWDTQLCISNYTQGVECRCKQRWKKLPDCQANNPCINTWACRNRGECESKCKHGECSAFGTSNHQFRCTCEPGWKGKRCNLDINECGIGNYWNHGYVAPTHSCSPYYGTCINTEGSYKCRCRNGWEGPYCTERRSCDNYLCQNNGSCISRFNAPFAQCMCPQGFTGSQCEVEDFCARRPCINGNCSNTGQGFSCSCFPGYTGVTCEDREDLCITEDCNSKGTCQEVREGRGWKTECRCEHGYQGERCQVDRVEQLLEKERTLNQQLRWKEQELKERERVLNRELLREKSKLRECEADKSKVVAFAETVKREMKELPWGLAGAVGQTDYYEESEGSGLYCR